MLLLGEISWRSIDLAGWAIFYGFSFLLKDTE